MSRKPVNNFVVYAYARKGKDQFGREGTFYYIGKGRPERPYDKTGRKNAKRPDDRRRILILHSGLTEEKALKYEAKLIGFYGRKNTTSFGVLRNLTDGGEGTLGFRRNPDKNYVKRELAPTLKDWYHPVHGEVIGVTSTELKRMFPEQKINLAGLSMVIYGLIIQHKGWRLLVNKYKTKQNYKPFDWYHPKFGMVENKTVAELCRMFLDQNLDQASLNRVSRGIHAHHKGWVTGGDNLLSSGEIPPHCKYKPIDWYHEEHGTVLQKSLAEMELLFPDQNLNRGCLCDVSNGKLFIHKGWILLKNKGIDYKSVKREKSIKKRFTWEHPVYGRYESLAVVELMEKFPEQNLSQGCLSQVSNRKAKFHKDWVLVE